MAYQWNAENGQKQFKHDVFGNVRSQSNELGAITAFEYDRLDRLLRVDRQGIGRVQNFTGGADGAAVASTLSDVYTYDARGLRLSHTDALGQRSTTEYDSLGRVVSTVSAGGSAVSYRYDFREAGAADGVISLGAQNLGGYLRTTTSADGSVLLDKIDVFGRTTWHQDKGGRKYSYDYNVAGSLMAQTSVDKNGVAQQNIRYDYFANGMIKAARDLKMRTLSTYGYDNAGNVHNNANTYRPYNPGEVIGRIDPTLPEPPPPPPVAASGGGKKGCGGIGTLLMVVVAVVVTVYTAGVLSGATGSLASTMSAGASALTGGGVAAGSVAASIGGTGLMGSVVVGAAASAAGSIASQMVGLATGNVDKFSWKSVGTAAFSGGITAGVGNGLGQLAEGGHLGKTLGTVLSRGSEAAAWQGAALRGAAASAVSQAMQGKWSWREVAAAGVASGAGAAAGAAVGSAFTSGYEVLGRVAGSALGAAAGGWASSQILGHSSEQTRARVGQAFINGLGQGIGSALGESLASGPQPKPALTFAQDKAARERANDPAGFGEFANYRSSSGVQTTRSYSAADLYSADDLKFDRMLLGDRLAAMAAPGTARAVIPDAYLAPDGSGHLMPQAPVVVDGQSLSALPGLDHSGYFGPGFVTSSYQQAVGMAADRNAPWYERGMGLVAGTAMSPLMLVEEAGRAMLNVPYHARQAGQYAAQFKLARTTDERVLAGLNFLNNGASAFVGTAPVIPSSVSLRPVMTAQEMAVAQFPGTEATAAARATYGNTGSAGRTLSTYTGDVYSPDFVGPVQWKYFYRGDATARTEFLSSMAQERGVQATTEFLNEQVGGRLSNIYAQHGIGSQGLPTIGASDNALVAEFFARGPSQTQNGFVTTFRMEAREAERLAIPNGDNPMSFEMANPAIGLPEREFLFHVQIDPKYAVKQVQVGPR